MAFQEYGDTQSINSMTTRQLRKYVSDKATEAQKRLDSMNISEQSEAIRESIHFITKGTNKRVYKGTSNLSKGEMAEMAYQLRIFERLDTDSGYAKQTEYERNKDRYETFIGNRKKDAYWKKYIDENGNISAEGFKEYKNYINFVKEISEVSQYFNYKTLMTKATRQLKTGEKPGERLDAMGKMINKIYTESKNQGKTPRQITEDFFAEWMEYEEQHNLKKTITRSAIQGKPEKYKPKKSSIPKPKKSKKSSSTNVKTKVVGKMKDNAKVHR